MPVRAFMAHRRDKKHRTGAQDIPERKAAPAVLEGESFDIDSIIGEFSDDEGSNDAKVEALLRELEAEDGGKNAAPVTEAHAAVSAFAGTETPEPLEEYMPEPEVTAAAAAPAAAITAVEEMTGGFVIEEMDLSAYRTAPDPGPEPVAASEAVPETVKEEKAPEKAEIGFPEPEDIDDTPDEDISEYVMSAPAQEPAPEREDIPDGSAQAGEFPAETPAPLEEDVRVREPEAAEEPAVSPEQPASLEEDPADYLADDSELEELPAEPEMSEEERILKAMFPDGIPGGFEEPEDAPFFDGVTESPAEEQARENARIAAEHAAERAAAEKEKAAAEAAARIAAEQAEAAAAARAAVEAASHGRAQARQQAADDDFEELIQTPGEAAPAPQAQPAAAAPAVAIRDLPDDDITQEELLRRTISDNVASVLDKDVPKPTVPIPEPAGSKKRASADGAHVQARFSDDLRSFRNLPPATAVSKAKSAVRFYGWRTWVLLALSVVAGYITAAPTYGWWLPPFISYIKLPFIYLLILTGLQIAGMLVAVSVIADGLRAAVKRKWRSETLVTLAALVNILYTMQIIAAPQTGGYLPYQMVILPMLFFVCLSRRLRFGALMHEARALSVRSGRYAEIRGLSEDDGTLRNVFKQDAAPLEKNFLNRLLLSDRGELFFRRYTPFAAVLTAVLAAVASLGRSVQVPFLWCWAALLSVSVPFGVLTAYVAPLERVAERLSKSATTLAGPAGVERLRSVSGAILQERDIFPTKMISMSNVRVFSGFTPEKVNLSVLSVLKASGCGLYHCMSASLPHTPVNMPQMEKFEYFESGGMGAYVNGDRVLIGSMSFIMRSGIRIPEGIATRTGIYVGINMQFAGVYPVKYEVQPAARRAMNYLLRRRITPVLAVRDFNISPSLVEKRFQLGTDAVAYPDLAERIRLASLKDANHEEPCAVTAMDTLPNYVDAVSAGKRVHTACSVSILTGLLGSAVGIMLVFFLLLTRTPSAVTPFNILYYLLLWYLPSLIMALGVNRR